MDNSVPGLDRGLCVMQALARHPGGLSAADLGDACEVPRATLYRIVRVLRAHGMVAPLDGDEARLVLGPGLHELARQARTPRDLARLLAPTMSALSAEVGETIKLVARDEAEAVTLAVAQSGNDSRIASQVGKRLPLYVGASQRLLLAHAPESVVAQVLQGRMTRYASRTILSAQALQAQFAKLRKDGFASGHGEGVEGVGAFAAMLSDASGRLPLVLVTVYVHGGKSAAERRQIAAATQAAAQAGSRQLLN